MSLHISYLLKIIVTFEYPVKRPLRKAPGEYPPNNMPPVKKPIRAIPASYNKFPKQTFIITQFALNRSVLHTVRKNQSRNWILLISILFCTGDRVIPPLQKLTHSEIGMKAVLLRLTNELDIKIFWQDFESEFGWVLLSWKSPFFNRTKLQNKTTCFA